VTLPAVLQNNSELELLRGSGDASATVSIVFVHVHVDKLLHGALSALV